jgi:hypothetical protein
MDPELLQRIRDSLVGIGRTVNQAVNPFEGRGIFGFGADVIRDIQRNPIEALTVVGDLEANLAGQELSQQGHPILGAGLQLLGAGGAATAAIPGVRGVTRVAEKAALEAVQRRLRSDVAERGVVAGLPTPGQPTGAVARLEHRGPRAAEIDVVDPELQGTGQPGAERRRQAAAPETHLPRSFFNRAGSQVEPRFQGLPKVEVEVPEELIAKPEEWRSFLEEAGRLQQARGAGGNPSEIGNMAEQIAVAQGFEAVEPVEGIVQAFTPQRRVGSSPSAIANRNIVAATEARGGATFTPAGENLSGQPLTAVARRSGDDRVLDGPLTPEDLDSFRADFAEDLDAEGAAIGTWKREDGKTVLDVVETFEDPVEAIRLGKERGQDGVFNLGTEEFIPTLPDPDELFGPGTQTADEFLGDLISGGRRLPERPKTAAQASTARLRHDNRSKANRAARTQQIEQGLNEVEREAFAAGNKRLRQTVEENYSKLPTPETFAQAAIRGAESRGWYQGSGAAIAESFGPEAPRFTALLAAMSPQKSVEENLRIALNTWGNWNAAGRPVDEVGLRAAIDSNLEADIGNAMRSLRASDEMVAAGDPALLNGPKVGPFYANLIGMVDPIVNDTHMARGFGTLPGGVGTKGRTLAQNAMVRNAAREFERITGQAVDPRELQEMSWAYIRGLTNAAGERGTALEVIEQSFLEPGAKFAGGLDVTERVRNSVSIGDLMARPEFAESLARAGVQAPTPRPPVGTPGVDPQSADINALRDIAERIDLVRQGKPLFGLGGVGLLGVAGSRREDR